MEPDRKRLKLESARARMRKSRAIQQAIKEFASTSSHQTEDDTDYLTDDTNLHEESTPCILHSQHDHNSTYGNGLLNSESIIADSVNEQLEIENEEEYYSAEEHSEVDESEFEDENNRGNDEIADELVQTVNMNEEREIDLLRKWAIKYKIRHLHVDELISILRQRLLPDLPKSAKTFLRTASAVYDIKKTEDNRGGNTSEFVYFGLVNGLKACVNTDLHPENRIYLQINIDGLPLYRSSTKQFWPILCKVHFDPDIYKPFPIAIYCGEEKPKSVDEYMEKFVTEVNLLQADGILIDGKNFEVRIKCFIADTPARTFIKCIKGHGGYAACERCTIYGERCNRRMIYNSAECPERTDVSFRTAEQPEHHNGVSPLTRIRPAINMVTQFLLDFMHLCCLGVMRKLLLYWLEGNFNVRWSRSDKIRLSDRMKNLRSQTPCEFERKPRTIFEIAHWKATEFRFFLFYCGPVVLKNILNSALYKHFLLLHASCRILCSKTLCLKPSYTDPVKVYLKIFFLLTKEYYGAESHVMNVHNIIHLVNDVENMKGSISTYTAFPFENLLGQIKKMLRTGNRPLAQVCRRLHEAFFIQSEKITLPPDVMILKSGTLDCLGKVYIQKLKYCGATISITAPNNYVILQSQEIIQIDEIFKNGEIITITGPKWKVKKSLFTYPCDSKFLKMWELQERPSSARIMCPLQSIESKMVILNVDEKFYGMPLLHL